MSLSRLARNIYNILYGVREEIAGYRYAMNLPVSTGEDSEVLLGERTKGSLERYFDDHTQGPGIWKWRHYFDIYERHFQRFVGQDVHVVEIGVFSGGSLPMWLDYFGDKARIYGVDNEESCRAYRQDRVEIFIGDQADPAFWREFVHQVPHIDIVIDDGGHRPHQQRATLEALLPHIAPGGVYLCEDIHNALSPFNAYLDGLMRPLAELHPGINAPLPVHRQIGSVHRYPLVAVIEKPRHVVPPFEAPRRGTEWQPMTFIQQQDHGRRGQLARLMER